MLKGKFIAAYPDEYAAFFIANRHGSTLRLFENWIQRTITQLAPTFRNKEDPEVFKGDTFELFAELFFNLFYGDPHFGVREYTPVPLPQDFGVDAVGINPNGDKAAVQVKYRGNPTDVSTYPSYADIARTFTSGVLDFGVDPGKDSICYFFTNACDVSNIAYEVMGNKLVVVKRDIIEHYVDNNKTFWRYAAHEVLEYIKSNNLI